MLIEDNNFGFCSNCQKEFNSELISEYNIEYCPYCGEKLKYEYTIIEFAEIIYNMIMLEKFPVSQKIEIGYNDYNILLSFGQLNVDYNNVFIITDDCLHEFYSLLIHRIKNKEHFVGFVAKTIVNIGGVNGKIKILKGQQFFA